MKLALLLIGVIAQLGLSIWTLSSDTFYKEANANSGSDTCPNQNPQKKHLIWKRLGIVFFIPAIIIFCAILQFKDSQDTERKAEIRFVTDSTRHVAERASDSAAFQHQLNENRAHFEESKQLLVDNVDFLKNQNAQLASTVISESGTLSTMALMNQTEVNKARIVFSFQKPLFSISPEDDQKFYPEELVNKTMGDVGRKPKGDIPLFLPPGRISEISFAKLSWRINRTDSMEFQDGNPWNPDVVYTYKEDGKSNWAIEYSPEKNTSLAAIYAKLKSTDSEIRLIKNYAFGTSKNVVEEYEKKFLGQGISVSFEVPIQPKTGVWYKVNLSSSVKANITEVLEPNSKQHYYSVTYVWKAMDNKGHLVFNPIVK